MLLPSLGGGIGNSYPPRPGDVMDDRIDSVIQSLTSSVEPSLYQMRSVTSSGVKLEDAAAAAAAAAMFNAASRSSSSSTSPPSMDSGNGLDQLIDTFTSTGLLQRSLDADELQIVSQQIQLQMQQTQLQMLQLALRQQQLQAAQMQLKLQHQSHMVHRRQHHQHNQHQHQHQQQCQQQHQPQQHHQNPSAESQHQSSEQHPYHTSASSTASDVMDTAVDSDNVHSSPGVASRWTSLGERSCDLKSPGAASHWTSPVERTCDEKAAVAASLWAPPAERTCDGRTRAETELDAKSLSNKMEPPSINSVPSSNDRRNIVSANQGCWQTGHMTMVTSSLTVDVKQQRSDDLMTHLHNDGMIGITSRPLSSRRCPSASLEEIERFAKLFKRRRIALGFTQCDVGMTMGKLYGNDFSQTTISRFEALNLSFKNMCKLKPLLEKWLDDVGRTGSNASGGNVNGAAQPSSHGSSTGAPQQQQQQQQQQGVIRTAGSVYSAAMSGASICGPGLGDIHGGSMVTLHAAAAAATIADTLQAANRRRKKRTNIDQTVRQALESFFRCVPKPTTDQINDVAERLGMDRDVIQVWFCNRRQKEKRVHPGAAGTPRHIHGVGSVGTSAVTNYASSNNGGLVVQSQGHVPAQGHG